MKVPQLSLSVCRQVGISVIRLLRTNTNSSVALHGTHKLIISILYYT